MIDSIPSLLDNTTSSHSTGLLPSHRLVGILCLVLGLTLGLVFLTPRGVQAQDTYVVDSRADADDATDDGACDDGNGNCTLRAAIEEADRDATRDTINFSNIPTNTAGFAPIILDANLGQIVVNEELVVDGTTAPGYPSSAANGPIVKINGANLTGSGTADLVLCCDAADSEIKGLALINAPDEGISVQADDISVDSSFVGIDVDGQTAQGNVRMGDGFYDAGIGISGGNNATLSGNLISGNQEDGINIDDNSRNNVIINNIIGLDYDGDAAKGNGGRGVMVQGNSNTIGDAFFDLTFQQTTDDGNVISANGGAGVYLQSDSNQVSANEIGTRADGSSATGTAGASLGNQVGIRVEGTGPGSNAADHNMIGKEAAPTDFFLNIDPSVAADRNLVSGNADSGVVLGDAGDNNAAAEDTLRDNVIGLNSAEDAAIPNGDDRSVSGGILGSLTSGTVIDSNTVSGNAGQGIIIFGNSEGDIDIFDNIVGTNASFASGLGNNFDGIQVKPNPSGNPNEVDVFENIVGSNSNDGIDVRGSYHDISNNYVGVAPDSTDLGNGSVGIRINGKGVTVNRLFIGDQANYPTEGDSSAAGHSTPKAEGNIIGFNGGDGILVKNDATDIAISQNYIGTNPSEADFGNGTSGSGSGRDGIRIVGDNNSSTSNISTGHNIGYALSLDPSGSPNPADGDGGFGNVIAFNKGDGISIGATESSSDVVGTMIRANIIFQNGGNTPQLGIDLGNSGVTSNDGGDGDSGPNGLQNNPEIMSVQHDDSNNEVEIEYEVSTNNTGSNYPLKIDFYVADSEASGEGKRYLGTQDYQTANSTNVVTFDLDNFSGVSSDDHFVATATDANGNTSEFFRPSEQLPVELASFEGTQTGSESVTLTWTTASEQNNAGFEVQRRTVGTSQAETSTENRSWSQVGFVESKASGGTTTEPRTYRYTVENLGVGTYEFRLRQVDLNGSTHLHDAITVDLRMDKALRLSAPAPNPVRDGPAEITFAVRERAETTIRLYNTLGQKVATVYRGTPAAGASTTARFHTEDLFSGVYFLRLRANERTTTRRFTVVR